MPYIIPRTVIYDSDKEILSHWLIEEGGDIAVIVDDIGSSNSIAGFLARRLQASIVKVGTPVSSNTNIIVAVGGWLSVNWSKYLACNRLAGNIGLLGVSEYREKAKIISIPLRDIRFNYIPRLLSMIPSPSIIEHPCTLPHEVLLISPILEKTYCISEATALSEILGEEIKLDEPWSKPNTLVKLYSEALGLIDAIAEALTLLLGVSYTSSLLSSIIASIRNSAFKPKGFLEQKPLETLLRNCPPSEIRIDSTEELYRKVEEIVFRSLSMYHLPPIHPTIIRNTIRDALRLIFDYSK